ncbi:MAG: serine/threonine protein kinase, partial [bacterium]|nr:serine/threonine protein kinase [bacterium]
MDSNRWKRIEKALDELLDLEPQGRESRLDDLSGGDAELRADLERLLAADDDERTGILDQGMAPLAGALLDPEQESSRAPGERIGPYRVLGTLGSGGMGEVLLAERADGAFDRHIALKVVPGDRVRDELVARLRHERQILARLRHPNIAALYDGGVTDAGAPYFAMELVKGESIIDYCDRARLGVDARLELFDRVCRAVQFAHRNLVIHRDIKPSNVFVTSDGEVKLLDFGIAKLVDDGEVTSAEQRFLTPAFAAPEQLKGEPTTTAVDIYALGLLLYELLSGRRPFGRKRDSAAMIRAVLQDDPTPLSRITGKDASSDDTQEIAQQRGLTVEALRRQLRGDLDTILDKAMRKDPGERYASAEGLRLDLLRYRSSQPVAARPATAGYKLRKFIRRNRLGVSLGAVAIVAGLLFSAWIGLLYSRAERNLSRATAAEASTAREAEALRQVSNFLTELFEVASPDASSGRDVTAREMLDAGAARIEEELDTEPHVRASLQLTMAASYRWLGRYEDAL